MTEYDIGAAFKAIEDELIKSIIRNMKKHRVEEAENEKQWEMWQAKQLESLERYKKKNRKKYKGQFGSINDSIDEIIREAYKEGGLEQEIEILEAIKKRHGDNLPNNIRRMKDKLTEKLPFGNKVGKDFFQTNDKRLDALVHATTSDMQTAETAMLRMADDQYRKIIFNAQTYAISGAGTYEKAVDMATKDFLTAGINCIEYRNGRRVNIKSYAEMVVRTSSKRAQLYADGQVRKDLGISTVIAKKRLNACPLCLPFVDKVLIDDVWSGGKPSDGPYPLVSAALKAGFFHPNCKDHLSTYIPGITEPPEGSFSEPEIEEISMESKKEAEQQYASRQADKYGRLASYSLSPENKQQYKQKAGEWEEKAGQRYTVSDEIKEHRVDTPEKMVELVNKYAEDEFVVLNEASEHAFAYDPDTDTIVINTKHSQYPYQDYNEVMLHELAHRIDQNEFGSPMNMEFSNAIVEAEKRILQNADRYNKMFDEGEPLEYNSLISDILGCITDNKVIGNYGHDSQYIGVPGYVELEVFADIFSAMYQGDDETVEFIKREIPDVYKTFMKVIGE